MGATEHAGMTREELIGLLRREDLVGVDELDLLDFKRQLGRGKAGDDGSAAFAKDVVAMANTPRLHGENAYIVFGVEEPDEGPFVVEGLRKHLREGAYEQKLSRHVVGGVSPSFSYTKVQTRSGRLLDVIEIPPQSQGPFYHDAHKGELWLRHNAICVRATQEQEDEVMEWFAQQQGVPVDAVCLVPGAPPRLLGREAEIGQIKEFLLMPDGGARSIGEGTRDIAIWGWPGVGKTALVQHLCHDADLNRAFHTVLYARLGRQPEIAQILARWGRSVSAGCEHAIRRCGGDLTLAQQYLAGSLGKKRVLFIVDDLWDSRHAEALRVGGPCAARIVTARSHQVADDVADGGPVLELRGLPAAEARALLRAVGGEAVDRAPEVMDAIIDELGGLPLLLRVAGSVLRKSSLPGGMSPEALLGVIREGGIVNEAAPASSDDWAEDEVGPRTVRSLLNVSLSLLPEADAGAFPSLGAFAPNAGFGLLSLGAVCDVDDPGRLAAGLHQAGLLHWDTVAQRFSIHGVIRAFARVLLTEDATGAALRSAQLRHAAHYASLLRDACEHCGTTYGPVLPEPFAAGLSLFDLELANIRLAQQWASKAAGDGDPDAAALCVQFADGPSRLFRARQTPQERMAWLRAALGVEARTRDERIARARTLMALSIDLGVLPHIPVDDRMAPLDEACQICRDVGDTARLAVARRLRADLVNAYRDPKEAVAEYEEILPELKRTGDHIQVCVALHNLGLAYQRLNRPDIARDWFRQSEVLARAANDPATEGSALRALARCEAAAGDTCAAIGALEGARQALKRSPYAFRAGALSTVHCDLAEQYLLAGREEDARRELGRALELRRKAREDWTGLRYDHLLGEDTIQVAVIANRLGDFRMAVRHATETVDLALRTGEDWLRAGAHFQRGLARQGLGQFPSAYKDLMTAWDLYSGLLGRHVPNWKATLAHFVGAMLEARFRHDGRRQYLAEARDWYTQELELWRLAVEPSIPGGHGPRSAFDPARRLALDTPVSLAKARARTALARVCRRSADFDSARDLAEQAMGYLCDHGSEGDVAALQQEIARIAARDEEA